jgi:hypothetical protein
VLGAAPLFPDETWRAALHQALAGKPDLIPLNEKAFAAGRALAARAEEVA